MDIATWAQAALSDAERLSSDPEFDHWWRHGRTWFVGVDALNNDAHGRIAGHPLPKTLRGLLGADRLHKAQVSIVTSGYPVDDASEPRGAATYRRRRDGAHVDGLLPVGPDRRRMVKEPHSVIVGIPLTPSVSGQSPTVVWESSHIVMQRAFRQRFSGLDPDSWSEVDVTEAYHSARREVFETCRRVELTAEVGAAYAIHRLALHGIAPWTDTAEDRRRIVAYFRPLVSRPEDWLSDD